VQVEDLGDFTDGLDHLQLKEVCTRAQVPRNNDRLSTNVIEVDR
jgi:hypothetical protein